ncbi:hypothetical protein [Amycolatopsis nigrescens]|uniref:hypothetical protein n=1 Tax=Amycolatopsis nigrescens TaxID=381445 RepID=UPI0003688D19|nr:hypothetical protein [Amycolatopsis nigrescens]
MWLPAIWAALVVAIFVWLPLAHKHIDRRPRDHLRQVRRRLRQATKARYASSYGRHAAIDPHHD